MVAVHDVDDLESRKPSLRGCLRNAPLAASERVTTDQIREMSPARIAGRRGDRVKAVAQSASGAFSSRCGDSGGLTGT